MDITILESNITDTNTVDQGLGIALTAVESFLKVNIKTQKTDYAFTNVPYQNPTIGRGYCVDPNQILSLVDGTSDGAFLLFDASKVAGTTYNPLCTYLKKGNTAPLQMCCQWYVTYPNVFAQYFLHELCHLMYFLLGIGDQDITHLLTDGGMQAKYPQLYDQFKEKQAIDYYAYLINSLMPAWNTYKAGKTKMQTLKINSFGPDVVTLQNNLIALGFHIKADGKFGPATQEAVEQFQSDAGLDMDGKVGKLTQAEIINELHIHSIMPKIDLWCEAIKEMEGAKPERNNPGNLRFVGQAYAVDDGGFCKFDTYEHGYEALKILLINACGGKSKIYHPTDTLIDFYKKYAPLSDNNNPINYADFVAKKIGVEPTTIINSLLY